MNKRKRFIPLKNYKGIRKDTLTGKYVARKYIDGKEYSETFSKVSKADNWRKIFHPLLTRAEIKDVTSTTKYSFPEVNTIQARRNGVDQRFTFGDVWGLYQKYHFPILEKQTKDTIAKFAKNFFPELMHLKMQEINPEVLDAFMEKKMEQARKFGRANRNNFRNDLKCLKALLNWYRENYDGMFVVPVLKRHFAQGVIKKAVKRDRKMTIGQVQLFLDSFDNPFWRDFATIHFFMAGRVQEVAGLQWSCIDFERGLIRVEDVSVWGNKKRFSYLKEIPKNGEVRIVCFNEQISDILHSRKSNKSNVPCEFFRESTGERLDFVFEIAGQPVSYRSVQHRYNKALKQAGLFPQFRSTHIMRKAMANIVRQELGLEAAQAVGGWKSRNIVEKVYTDAPNTLNKQAVEHVGKLVRGTGTNRNSPLKLVKKC